MANKHGICSISYEEPVYIKDSAAVVGKKEGSGPLKGLFDMVATDDLLGGTTWEEGENNFVKNALQILMDKNPDTASEIRYILGGDLLGQGIGTSFGVEEFHLPFFGLYGACSISGEALSLGSMLVDAGCASYLACVTSSHFASAEKEFRTPLDYGTQRPLCTTWTVTGSGAFLLAKEKPEKKGTDVFVPGITGISTGRIVDYGVKDSMNMGCCMAPAAADTLMRHFTDFNREPDYYDRIITGDLGMVGREALLLLLREKGIEISDRHIDCGIEMFDNLEQKTNSGGSGCGCAATVLSALILPKIRSGEWRRVLFLAR